MWVYRDCGCIEMWVYRSSTYFQGSWEQLRRRVFPFQFLRMEMEMEERERDFRCVMKRRK